MVAVNYDWDELEDNVVEEYDDALALVVQYTTERRLYGNIICQERGGSKPVDVSYKLRSTTVPLLQLWRHTW